MTDFIEPSMSLQEFYERQKTENIVLESANQENMFDDIEDWCEDIYDSGQMETDSIPYFVNLAKHIPVLTTKKFHIDADWLIEQIQDYADDNYAMHYWDGEIEAIDLVKDFVKRFNEQQSWYVSDKLVGYVDASKEVKEWLLNEFELTWDDVAKKELLK